LEYEKVEEGQARRHHRFDDLGACPTHAAGAVPTHAVGEGPTHAVGEVPTHAVGEGSTHVAGAGPKEGRGRDKPRAHDRYIKELRRHIKGVLDRVPEDLWVQMRDEGALELCIGGDQHWRSVIRQETVVGAAMTGHIPTVDISPGGLPPDGDDVPQLGSP
jgi:hypothetical protein